MTTLVLVLKNIESDDKTKYDTLYIDDVFESIYTTNISNIQKSLGKGLDWII